MNIYLVVMLLFLSLIIFYIVLKNNDLKKQKKLIEFEKEKFRQIIDNSSDGIHLLDLNGNLVEAGESFARMLGYKLDEILGLHISNWDTSLNLKNGSLPEDFLKESKLLNTKHKRKDQSIIDVQVHIKPIVINEEPYIYVIARDITKFKEQELIVLQQSKMAAIGEMLANIAHQWRQPLSIISTLSTGLKVEKEINGEISDEFLFYSADEINKNSQYLSRTIDTFRNYIKERKEKINVVLQNRIDFSLEIVEPLLKNNHIKLINNIDIIPPINIELVVGELSQVIINIINNAKDALVERKVLEPWIKISLEEKDDKAIISIEDNAGGISREILPHIFEPYFTTKYKSQGTGLGLHICFKIVTESLNGKIYVKNTEDGSNFFIELPLK